jgi:hypothetical protein
MQRPWNLAPPRPVRLEPCLTFAPLAWLKLAFFCHLGETEIGGFGLSAPDHLLHVQDFMTVRQQSTAMTVRFLDDGVADHFDRCVEQGLSPECCGRLWIHTHPGDSPLPSSVDEETFARGFGSCDWAVMMILARSGQTFARLTFNVGPRVDKEISVRVDWSAWPETLLGKQTFGDHADQWRQEYEANIHRHFPALSIVTRPDAPVGMPSWESFGKGLVSGDFDPLAFEEDIPHECRDCPHAG